MSCRAASLTAVLIMAAAPAAAGALPTRVGACVVTTIESVETRLVDGATNQPIAGLRQRRALRQRRLSSVLRHGSGD